LRQELELAAVLIQVGEDGPVQARAESGDKRALEIAVPVPAPLGWYCEKG